MMVNGYAILNLPKIMYLPTLVPYAETVGKSSGNVASLSFVLSRELFAKICRAERAASKGVDSLMNELIRNLRNNILN